MIEVPKHYARAMAMVLAMMVAACTASRPSSQSASQPTPSAPVKSPRTPSAAPAPERHPMAAALLATPPFLPDQSQPRVTGFPRLPVPSLPRGQATAKYPRFADNGWISVTEKPVSTFSADVDTGSYANVRRFIGHGRLPPKDAVRVEELVNYFEYDYESPEASGESPFAVRTTLVASPWNRGASLLRVAIKGKDTPKDSLPPANLVFLVDVSGSMAAANRLPLIRSALKLLVAQLRPVDRVAVVSYASGTRVVLGPTPGDQSAQILRAIDTLSAGGSTYGEAGIRLAYAQAHVALIDGGINRVLMATDGDLNVGMTNVRELKALVEGERRLGVGLTTLGVGDDNYNEVLMKQLADAGDGSYHYLDSLQEAHKVLVNQFTSTLATIAQDLKLQLEFNPATVVEYRLIGYEMRALVREQFNDDKVDGGDIGAGHTVTALYELVPRGAQGKVDELRYRPEARGGSQPAGNAKANELGWVKVRFKQPGHKESRLLQFPVQKILPVPQLQVADVDMRFAVAVAGWGQWLRGSTFMGDWGPGDTLALARAARGEDRWGHRAEFLRLVDISSGLTASPLPPPSTGRGR